jgi:hypothetical protein
MAFLKAIVIGAILTLVVSAAIHGGGSTGSYLTIHELMISGHAVAWSWPLFFVATGFAWGILWLMR